MKKRILSVITAIAMAVSCFVFPLGEASAEATNSDLPVIRIGEVTNITKTTATLNAYIDDVGSGKIERVNFYLDEKENSIDLKQYPVNPDGITKFTVNISFYDNVTERTYTENKTHYVYFSVYTGTTFVKTETITFKNDFTPGRVTDITATSAKFHGGAVKSGETHLLFELYDISRINVPWKYTDVTKIKPKQIKVFADADGEYTAEVTGLLPNTTYFLEANTMNGDRVAEFRYRICFTTLPGTPTVRAGGVTDITKTSATLHGFVDGGVGIIKEAVFTVSGNDYPVTPHGAGEYTYTVAGLSPGTKYSYVFRAENEFGSECTELVYFTTKGDPPVVRAGGVTDITRTSATLHAFVDDDVDRKVTMLLFSIAGENKWLTFTGVGEYTCIVAGLSPDTEYSFVLWAGNETGSDCTELIHFTTLPPDVPVVKAGEVTDITGNSATLRAFVDDDGGIITEAVFTVAGKDYPVTPHGTGEYTYTVTDLSPETEYSFTFRAKNATGQKTADEIPFKTGKIAKWKVLWLVYDSLDVTVTVNGTPTDFTTNLSEKSKKIIAEAAEYFEKRIEKDAYGLVDIEIDYVISPNKVTDVSSYGSKSYWIAPDNIRDDLDFYAPIGKYDSIIVSTEQGGIPRDEYWGLTYPTKPLASANYAGYSYIAINEQWDNTEVYIHEWLHQLEGYFGSPFPGADNMGGYGYTNMSTYYTDILQNKVYDSVLGKYVGISSEMWNSSPTKTYIPVITTASLPDGITNTVYNQTLDATCIVPITWSVSSGSLPDGLTLNGATISGTPTEAGTFTFTVTATNSAGSDTKEFTITVTEAAPIGDAPTITTSSLLNGTVGVTYNQTLSATGTTPITWSIASGNLPTGLSLSESGIISGTPTVAGTFGFTVKAANSAGSNTKTFTIIAMSTSGINPYVPEMKIIGTETGFEIDLNTETLTKPSAYTIAAYSTDGGTKWIVPKAETFTTKFSALLDKGMKLRLTDAYDAKTKKPASGAKIVAFADINKRPSAPAVSVYYDTYENLTTNGAWTLKLGTNFDATEGMLAAEGISGKEPAASAYGTFYDKSGIPVKSLNSAGKAFTTKYFIRIMPAVSNGVYTPRSKAKSLTVSSVQAQTKYTIDYKNESIKTLKKGDAYSIDGGATYTTVLTGSIDEMNNVNLDIREAVTLQKTVFVKKAVTATKPASAEQKIVFTLNRADFLTDEILLTNGKMSSADKSIYEIQKISANNKISWVAPSTFTESQTGVIRVKSTAKLVGKVWTNKAASVPYEFTVSGGKLILTQMSPQAVQQLNMMDFEFDGIDEAAEVE